MYSNFLSNVALFQLYYKYYLRTTLGTICLLKQHCIILHTQYYLVKYFRFERNIQIQTVGFDIVHTLYEVVLLSSLCCWHCQQQLMIPLYCTTTNFMYEIIVCQAVVGCGYGRPTVSSGVQLLLVIVLQFGFRYLNGSV